MMRLGFIDPEAKKLSMQWKHPGSPPPPPKKVKRFFSREGDGIFLDSQGIIMVMVS